MTEHTITILGLEPKEMKKEMQRMGVHPGGIPIMMPKSRFIAVKVKDVSPTSANIIKQDMLSFGGEAVTSAGTINHTAKKTDVLIMGTQKQVNDLILKLKKQYFGLKQMAYDIETAVNNSNCASKSLKIKGKKLDLKKRTCIMGILNLTPDSFSDGGKYPDPEFAVDHAKQMIRHGADIIDIGGESTRPGAKGISEKEEKLRVIPVIKRLAKETTAIISIDTTKASVADAAIKAGASMINDISGLRFDSKMAKIAAKHKVPVVAMHIQGKPRSMQANPRYSDLMSEIIMYLQKSISIGIKAGVPRSSIIVDPGFGFGKTAEQNLTILKRLKELKVLGCPILIGTSRKSTIGKVLGLPVNERLEGTLATVAVSIANGADIVRVHDVKEAARVAKMCDSIYK